MLQRGHSAAADKCKLHKRRTRCPRHSNRTCFSYWFKQRQDNAKDMITSPLTFCQSSTTLKALQQKTLSLRFTFSARLFFVYLMFHQATQESWPFLYVCASVFRAVSLDFTYSGFLAGKGLLCCCVVAFVPRLFTALAERT